MSFIVVLVNPTLAKSCRATSIIRSLVLTIPAILDCLSRTYVSLFVLGDPFLPM